MTAARIPCLNPACRRTAAAERYPGCRHIICQKCWKQLPARMKARHRQLNDRSNLFFKLSRRHRYQDVLRTPQWQRIERLYDEAWDRLNQIIIRYFTASEQPIGLEDFLKENGIADR